MKFPKTFRAGDYVQWRLPSTTDNFNDPISSPDWSVTYYFRTNAEFEGASTTSTAYLDGFEFSLASSVTETFEVGEWFYQAVADKSGAEKQTIATGQFEVLESLVYTGSTPPAYDGRSQVEKDLETIETAIRTLISGGAIKEYKIGNRNAKKYELAELLTLKSQYKVELVREKQAETMANGLGNPRATFVRFDGAY